MVQTNKTSHSKHLTLKSDPQLKGVTVILSKKVAKLAVDRNKLRRRIKETIRVFIKDKKTPLGLVVGGRIYTRKGIENLTYKDLKKEVLSLFT